MKTPLFNYLRFTRAERNGTFTLLMLAGVLFAIPEFTRQFETRHSTDFSAFLKETRAFRFAVAQNMDSQETALFVFDPNTASLEDFVRLGLSEKVAKTICNYRSKGAQFRKPADFQKIWSLDSADYHRLLPFLRIGSQGEKQAEKQADKPLVELFSFDPNSATASDLERLGLSPRTIKSILNYRAKGGQFRKKEDLEKIYSLDPEDYARISPYATFSEALAATVKPFPGNYAGPRSEKLIAPGSVDINRASLETWMTLPGVGEIRARQLVNYREKLGGFRTVEQLREMSGMPDSVFQGIRPFLGLSAPEIKKINLNTASVADLDAHPYISKRQAELIVAYREHHGAFASPEDIARMRAFSDQAWLAKVKPYLGVE